MSLSVSLGGCFVCFRWKVIHFRIWQSISFGEADNLIPFSGVHYTHTQLNCGKFEFFFPRPISTVHRVDVSSIHSHFYYIRLFESLLFGIESTHSVFGFWHWHYLSLSRCLSLSLSLFEAFASKHEPPDLTHLVLKLFYQTVSTAVTKILVSLDGEYIWPKQKVKTTF